ncbi:MAG: hypothetical protein HYV37_02515 [Candidatus Levyibacteriota bacterium]|nr:MAG: hypothetical protein HYV37_02515 [Candidatus Levybacteria bacterium]
MSKNNEKIITLLKENKKTVLAIFTVFIVVESQSKRLSSDFVIFSALLLYGIFIKIFQIKSTSTFLLCLLLLVEMSIDYLLTGASISTEKAAVWLILFLGVGVIQQWRE